MNSFLIHPVGEEFSLATILVLKMDDINIANIFAWKLKTITFLFFINWNDNKIELNIILRNLELIKLPKNLIFTIDRIN